MTAQDWLMMLYELWPGVGWRDGVVVMIVSPQTGLWYWPRPEWWSKSPGLRCCRVTGECCVSVMICNWKVVVVLLVCVWRKKKWWRQKKEVNKVSKWVIWKVFSQELETNNCVLIRWEVLTKKNGGHGHTDAILNFGQRGRDNFIGFWHIK